MDPRIAEVLQRLPEVDDEQLGDLEELLREQLTVAADAKDVDTARTLAEAIDQVRGESLDRAELARKREAEIAEIMNRVNASNESGEEETSSDDAGDEKPDEDKNNSNEEEGDRTEASRKDRPLPKIGDMLRKRSSSSISSGPRVKVTERAGTTIVVAASDVPGFPAGQEIPDTLGVRAALLEKWKSSAGSQTSGRIPVVRMEMNYPEDRILRAGDPENWDKVRRFLSPPALLAAGGICAPVQGFYETNTLATAERPLRNSLPVFNAERGAISVIPSSSVSDFTSAIGVITEAEDTSGGAGGTKPCLTIVCESPNTYTIQAISRCLQFGNFNARTHPEYVSHIADLTVAQHARVAEQELWEAMCAASTAVTAAENLSAWRDLYATVGRAAAFFRSRHRMSPDAVIRLAAPAWLATMLSIDLVRQAPGDGTVEGVARSQFETGLRRIGVNVTWTLEGGTSPATVTGTGIFGTQGAGPLDGWPDSVEMLFYPEGTFLFLDGGTLDLGIVRDSTLNLSNNFQTFAESFEAVAFLGPESLCLTLDVCPSGLAAGHDDSPLNCAVGVGS